MKSLFRLLVALSLLPALAHAQMPPPPPRMEHSLHVTGTYSVKATPDIAYVDFTVLADAKALNDAKEKADSILREVKQQVEKLGIEAKDVKTGYVSIQPKYVYRDNRPPLLDGYNVSYNLTLTVRKLESLGNAVQRLIGAGVTQVNNVRYDLDKSDQFKLDALKQAVANGHEKAKILATAAGSSLGSVIHIEEGGVSYNSPVMPMAAPMMARADMAMEKSVGEIPPAGELNVSANVTLVYELKN